MYKKQANIMELLLHQNEQTAKSFHKQRFWPLSDSSTQLAHKDADTRAHTLLPAKYEQAWRHFQKTFSPWERGCLYKWFY